MVDQNRKVATLLTNHQDLNWPQGWYLQVLRFIDQAKEKETIVAGFYSFNYPHFA